MSEVKGTLLALVLAISIFSIIYVVINATIRQNAEDVATRMTDASRLEPADDLTARPETLVSYHF